MQEQVFHQQDWLQIKIQTDPCFYKIIHLYLYFKGDNSNYFLKIRWMEMKIDGMKQPGIETFHV